MRPRSPGWRGPRPPVPACRGPTRKGRRYRQGGSSWYARAGSLRGPPRREAPRPRGDRNGRDGARPDRAHRAGSWRPPFRGFKPVHFNQQLVESLLALVVSAAQARAAMAADGVDFVDEDDAGSVLLALLEQVAHAAGAYAHEHLHAVRTGDGEERHAGLAGDGARQQRLAGAWRADQQHTLGNTSAQLLKLLRLAQEFDDFLQLLLGLFHARDVLEGHLRSEEHTSELQS